MTKHEEIRTIGTILDLLTKYSRNSRQSLDYLDELLKANDDPAEIIKVYKELRLWKVSIKKTSDIACHLIDKFYNGVEL